MTYTKSPKPRPIECVMTDTGCIVPVSHKLKPNGYCQLRQGERGNVLLHRLAWERRHGEAVPEGHEVDHICHNPSCCNTEHLQLLTKEQHRILNKDQSKKKRRELAILAHRTYDYSSHQLADLFGVTLRSAQQWIRDYNINKATQH